MREMLVLVQAHPPAAQVKRCTGEKFSLHAWHSAVPGFAQQVLAGAGGVLERGIGFWRSVTRMRVQWGVNTMSAQHTLDPAKNVEQHKIHLNRLLSVNIAKQCADSLVACPDHLAVGEVNLSDFLACGDSFEP